MNVANGTQEVQEMNKRNFLQNLPYDAAAINDITKAVADSRTALNDHARQFAIIHKEIMETIWPGFSGYNNPFQSYLAETEKAFDTFHARVFNFCVAVIMWTHTPNIDYDPTRLFDEYINTFSRFDAVRVAESIYDKFIVNSSLIAYEQLLSEARKLIPDNSKSLSDILTGKTMKFVIYFDQTYDGKGFHTGSREMEKLTSFEKLVRILIDKLPPESVKGDALYRHLYKYNTYGLHEINVHHIAKVRVLKNHSLSVELDTQKNAQLVASKLLSA